MYSILNGLDLKDFEICESNKYKAVIYISKLARHRRKLVNYVITESEAITWVISGVKPDNLYNRIKNNKKLKNEGVLPPYDRLVYINDKEVVECVKISVKHSSYNHLVYIYNEIKDKHRQARVRILTNMIVDELYVERVSHSHC